MSAVLLASVALAEEPPTPEEHLRAVSRYRDEHLEVRATETWSPGRAVVVPPYPAGSWSPVEVVCTPPEVDWSWAVFEGPRLLPVPDYLRRVGRDADADALDARIRRNRRAGAVLAAVGVAGLGAAIGGTAGLVAEPPEPTAWAVVAAGGAVAGTTGALGAGLAYERAAELARDYPATQDLPAVQDEVRSYDEALRRRLGLAPDALVTRAGQPPCLPAQAVVREHPPAVAQGSDEQR